MAIKGTATIELTNADGTKEVIKHDNMITNAVADLCFSQRGEMAAILKIVNQNDSYAQAMFGGILLFDEVLNSDPADYQIPTTKITGYASQDAYAGLDLARGSFNQAEGGVQEDGSYKFVWDFSTSQANGTIKSLALCPNIMGKIGASDTIVSRSNFNIGRDPSAPFDSSGWLLDSSGSTNGISNYNYRIVAIDGDIAYAADYWQIKYHSRYSQYSLQNNGGILKLYRFKLGSTSISLACRAGMATYVDSIDVQMPSSFVNQLSTSDGRMNLSFFYDNETKKITVSPVNFKAGEVGVNGTVYYVEIEISDSMTATLCTFTNTTGGVLYPNVSTYEGYLWFYAIKDYIIVKSYVSGSYRMYIVNRTNNTDIKEVQFAGSPLSGTSGYYGTFRYNLSTSKILVFGQYTDGDGNYYTNIVDLTTGLLKSTNASSMRNNNNIDIGNNSIRIMTGVYLTYYVVINPFILTTKNNLDSPVTKTASQTMKITYTLSEVAE